MSESKATTKRERKPLKVACKKTKCNENLHCFLDAPKRKKDREQFESPVPENAVQHKQFERPQTQSAEKNSAERCCWNCGINLIDWNRVHTLHPDDVDYLFNCLKHEYVRHDFWCKDIDQWAINNARRRGRLKMPQYAEKCIRQAVGGASSVWSGRQTSADGDVLYYAQHATATCCRKCMEVWYGIPQGRELSEDEVQFFTGLLLRYVDERMPYLGNEPEYVPPIRKQEYHAANEQGEEVGNK